MDFETIHPIISGLIGGAIATYFCSKWIKNLPKTYNNKSRSTLLKENKLAINAANTVFFICLVIGFFAYKFNFFQNNDWHGIGLIFGFALFAPLIFIISFGLKNGKSGISEAFLAYSINQKMPPKLLLFVLLLGTVLFFITCIQLIT